MYLFFIFQKNQRNLQKNVHHPKKIPKINLKIILTDFEKACMGVAQDHFPESEIKGYQKLIYTKSLEGQDENQKKKYNDWSLSVVAYVVSYHNETEKLKFLGRIANLQ